MNTLHSKLETTTTTLAADSHGSATATKPRRIEAYGVKGMRSRPWRRTFKDADTLAAWCEENGAEVYGTRDVDGR
jgi:hypothetical protein